MIIRKQTVVFITLTIVSSILIYKLNLFDYLRILSQEMASNGQDDASKASNVYGFKVKDIDGNEVDMEKYRGKVLVIVNTATNCGLTKSNIKELNVLYDKFKDKQFQILGFPSNSFKQELSCETDIKEFVNKNNIQWDYFSRVEVNGDNTEPIFRYLKQATSGFFGKFIKWNYTKFLVNKQGVAVRRYAPTDSPAKIESEITKLLEE